MVNTNIIIESIVQFIPGIMLYAELHYRFRFSDSRYYQNEPEILADIPIRIEPNNDLPVLLIIKDAHLFPVTLHEVKVLIYQSSKLIQSHNYPFQITIDSNWWDNMILIKTDKCYGNIDIDVQFSYEVNRINKICNIHNYPLSSSKYLTTYISKYPFPNDGNVIYGDLHYHSNLTDDMVEFGAPLKATLRIARSMGLDFFCNTDHSYDLDDKPGSWNETDPTLEKWNNSREHINELNMDSSSSNFIIPSEELSLHNLDGRNIHALILNNRGFLPGSGDSAERPFDRRSDYNTHTVHEILDNDSLCIAAHPFTSVPLLQWIFLKRGKWHNKDILHANMMGIQILNGAADKAYYKGLSIWIKLLLKGYHKFIYAGNDAHGNFNVYRQIKVPMISLYEKSEQLFGQFRTGVICKDNKRNVQSAVTAMKSGKCFVTNGPFIRMTYNKNDSIYEMGSAIQSNYGFLNIYILSSQEFGKIKKIVIKKGIIGNNIERDCFTIINPQTYELKEQLTIYTDHDSYYRCEVELELNGGMQLFALTNPIWIKPIDEKYR